MAINQVPPATSHPSSLGNAFKAINNNFAEMETISGGASKEVGVGKDFETLSEALRFAETYLGNSLTILIPVGVHELKVDDEWFGEFKLIGVAVSIEGIGGAAQEDNTIITLSSDSRTGQAAVFNVQHSNIGFKYITFDGTAGGRAEDDEVNWFVVYGSNLHMSHVFILNGKVLINLFDGSVFISVSSAFTGTNTARDVIAAQYGSEIVLDGVAVSGGRFTIYATRGGKLTTLTSLTVSDADNTGIWASRNTPVFLEGTITFTNNTADTNIPLNEIQYDGSFICNGTAALSFKA